MKLTKTIKNYFNKILEDLYIKPNKEYLKLLEETSLDGFKVIEIGDDVVTRYGTGRIVSIDRTDLYSKDGIVYGVKLDLDYYGNTKSGVIYFKGSTLNKKD